MKERLYYFIIGLLSAPFLVGTCLFMAVIVLLFPLIALIDPEKFKKWSEEQ